MDTINQNSQNTSASENQGDLDKEKQNQNQGEQKPNDSDTKPSKSELNFRKLEKAKSEVEAERDALRAEKAESNKAKLEEQGKYKELLDAERKEKEEIKTKAQNRDRLLILEKALKKSGANEDLIDFIAPNLANQVEFDKDNNPKNIQEVLETLKSEKPSLFITTTKSGNTSTGVTTGSNNPNSELENATDNASLSTYIKTLK